MLYTAGFDRDIVGILEKYYAGSKVRIGLQNFISDFIEQNIGLKQGCVLSPLLFALVIDRLAKSIEDSLLGATVGSVRIPGLLYADDIVLMANSPEELQSLLNRCAEFGSFSGLDFNVKKSQVMEFHNTMDGMDERMGRDRYSIGDKELIVVNTYTYLGVDFSTDGFSKQEDVMLTKLVKLEGMLGSRLRCCFNKYIVARTFWKGIAVPVGMYALESICYSTATMRRMEGVQCKVARKALGAPKKAAVESLQGEMGWSTFKEREAKAKLKFVGRLQLLGEDRMICRIFQEMVKGRINTKWSRKVMKLMGSVGIDRMKLANEGKKKWIKTVEKAVREWGLNAWKEGVAQKKSLKLYAYKTSICAEGFYDNSLGSRLLFAARCGCLPTQEYRGRYIDRLDITCGLCREDVDDLVHVMLECNYEQVYEARERLVEVVKRSLGESEEKWDRRTLKEKVLVMLGLGMEKEVAADIVKASKEMLSVGWRCRRLPVI